MNWYKKAQIENLSQFELSKMIRELIPQYKKFLDKEWDKTLTHEEKELMKRIGNKMDSLGDLRKQKIEQQQEISEQAIQRGDPHEVLSRNFINYHNTGNIQENAYKQYETKEGISWLGTPEKYPILLSKKEIENEIIFFRKKDEKLKYTQKDPKDLTGWEFLRDEKKDLIYMSDEQIKEKELPATETSIVAFNSSGEPIGWVSNEFGADGVWVIKEYQGKGIGTDLLYEFRKQFKPGRKIGQMTGSGVNMTRSYHKKLVEEALRKGKNVPMETLQEYELV